MFQQILSCLKAFLINNKVIEYLNKLIKRQKALLAIQVDSNFRRHFLAMGEKFALMVENAAFSIIKKIGKASSTSLSAKISANLIKQKDNSLTLIFRNILVHGTYRNIIFEASLMISLNFKRAQIIYFISVFLLPLNERRGNKYLNFLGKKCDKIWRFDKDSHFTLIYQITM